MRQVVDFRSSNGDTGYPESDAILPVADGESANQAVLRRPTENTRLRTETLRTLLREYACLADTHTRLYSAVQGNPITFDGVYPGNSGVFTIGTDLVVLSMGSPGRSTSYPYIGSSKAALSVGTPASNEVVFTSVKKQWEGSSFPAADANAIAVEIVAGSSVTVTLKGPNLDHIYITIVSGTTTCNDVISAVNGSAANTLVLASLGAGSTGTNAAGLWGTAQWGGDYTKRFLKGGVAGVIHKISSSVLSTFFAASTANRIQEGDMIGIWYDKNVDTAGTGGRLQSTYENGNYALTAGQLFNSRREPEKVPNGIPICKCISATTLLFADGSYIQNGFPAPLGFDSLQWQFVSWGDANLAAYCYNGVNEGIQRVTTGTHGHNPAVSIREAFENTDEQVHYLRGHTAAYYSVTDGSTTTGGQFDSSTGIQDAIAAAQAANGGTILVRRGTYAISVKQTCTKPIRIIATEGPVTVQTFVDEALTFQTNNHSLEGLYFIGITSSFEILWASTSASLHVKDCTFQTSGLKFSTTGHVEFNNCTFSSIAATYAIGSSAASLRMVDCTINANATAFQITSAGKHELVNCVISVTNAWKAFECTNCGGPLVLTDVTIWCEPFGIPVVELNNTPANITNLTFMMTAGGESVSSNLLRIEGKNVYCTNVKMNLMARQLKYAGTNSPIYAIGDNIVLDHIELHNFYIPFGATWLDTLTGVYPMICIAGATGDGTKGTVTLQHSKVHTMYTASKSGVGTDIMSGAIVGAPGRSSSNFGTGGCQATYKESGRIIVDDLTVDATVKYARGDNALSRFVAVTNLQNGSIVKNCNFSVGTYKYVVHAVNARDVTIENNLFMFGFGQTYGTGESEYECLKLIYVTMDADMATFDGQHIKVLNNRALVHDFVYGAQTTLFRYFHIEGKSGDPTYAPDVRGNQVTNNDVVANKGNVGIYIKYSYGPVFQANTGSFQGGGSPVSAEFGYDSGSVSVPCPDFGNWATFNRGVVVNV